MIILLFQYSKDCFVNYILIQDKPALVHMKEQQAI